MTGADPTSEMIADRYRIERLLGRGGMAAVYQVRDTLTQRVVALKRLLRDGEAARAQIERLFELEYHTLAQLSHPNIVDVYEYHVDGEGAFYTMELLTGGDLRQLAPLPWPALCRRLCDVSSALALLHSRRFVHRDLTPLNVRGLEDGRTKLLDFGSMTTVGRTKYVVGTPPFIAPEVVNGEIIDGQTDLFSLGATAYYALTRQHAYPARTVAELPRLWLTPPRAPSELVPGIPAPLDALILELLSLAPLGRPRSAAEVIERLSAIGNFTIEEQLVVRSGYLNKPTLVGRHVALSKLTRVLHRLEQGRGAAVLISGAPGTGRSRLLDASVLSAKLSGALVLRSDARDSESRRWGAVMRLLDQFSVQLPELSAELIGSQPALTALAPLDRSPPPASLSPRSSESTGPEVDASASGRAEIQRALQAVLLGLAHERRVVLVVDDLDQIDEPSAALLALLANQAREHALVVIGSQVSGAEDGAARHALQLMAAKSVVLSTSNLDAVDTAQLVRSLFGDVPNVRLLADRIFGVTSGNPLLIMRVAQHLVDTRACRYASGTWSLPGNWDADILHAAVRERIDPELSPSALATVRCLALSGLSSVTREEWSRLASHGDFIRVSDDLHALAAAGIVTFDPYSVGLTRSSWEPLLLAELEPAERRALHLRVAELLVHRPAARFRTAQHLLHAGQVERALDLLLEDIKTQRPMRIQDPLRTFEYLQSLPKNWPETYHALIDACRTSNRPLRDQLDIQIELLAYATLGGGFERELTLELAARLRYDSGLDLMVELADRVAPSELIATALRTAQERYESTPERERGLPLVEALTVLGQLIIQTLAMAGRSYDLGLLHALPSLAPLAPLSSALAVVQKNLESSIAVLSGRGLRAREPYLEILRRLDEPDGAGLGTTHRTHMRSAVLWAVGALEAEWGRPSTLERATEIESNPLFAVSALQLRAQFALVRGDRASAERYRNQTELLRIQNSPPQMFQGAELFRFTSIYAVLGDLLRVKQCLSEIEALACNHVGWRPVAHFARGSYQALRGDHLRARTEFETALATVRPGEHMVWASCAGALIWELMQLDQAREAVESGHRMLASAAMADVQASSPWILVPLALAESRTDRVDLALEHIHCAIEDLGAEDGGSVMLGVAYEVRAQIALQMEQRVEFERYIGLCSAQCRVAEHAGFSARVAKLIRKAGRLGFHVAAPDRWSEAGIGFDELRALAESRLAQAHGAAERAQCALRMIGEASGGDVGFLYLLQRGRPTLVAQLGSETVGPEFQANVEALLAEAQQDDTVTLAEGSGSSESMQSWRGAARRFTPLLLSHPVDSNSRVVGVALMSPRVGRAMTQPNRLLQVLSQQLSDAGDGSQS